MANTIAIAFIALAIVQLVCTLVYLVKTGQLLHRLEAQHPEVHEAIGRPLLIANNTPRNNVLFIRWLWRRDFETLQNTESIALARLVRLLLLWLFVGFAVLIAIFLVLSFAF